MNTRQSLPIGNRVGAAFATSVLLLPTFCFFLAQLAWRQGNPTAIRAFLGPVWGTPLEAPSIFVVVLACPVLAVVGARAYLRNGGNRALGIMMFLGGPLLAVAIVATHPA